MKPISINRTLWRHVAYYGFFHVIWVVFAFVGRIYLGVLTPQELNDILEGTAVAASPPADSFYLSLFLVLMVYGLPWMNAVIWYYLVTPTLVAPQRTMMRDMLRFMLNSMLLLSILISIFAIYVELLEMPPEARRIGVQLLELFTHAYFWFSFPVGFLLQFNAYRDYRIHRSMALIFMAGVVLQFAGEIYFNNPETPAIRWVFSIFTGHAALTTYCAYALIVANSNLALSEDHTPTLVDDATIPLKTK